MSNPIKFSEQEIKDLTELQSQYQTVIYQLGQIQIEKRILESREAEVTATYESLRDSERSIMDSLNKKYGDGTLNLENGTFTPNT